MTFWRICYHLTWSTQNREATLTPVIEKELYPFLVNKSLDLDCRVFAVNGCEDHVHMVISIPPKYSVSEIVKRLKGASSHDLKIQWQEGFGVMSVGERDKHIPIRYVENQKQHHASKTTNVWLERRDGDEEGHRVREEDAEYRMEEDDGKDLLF